MIRNKKVSRSTSSVEKQIYIFLCQINNHRVTGTKNVKESKLKKQSMAICKNVVHQVLSFMDFEFLSKKGSKLSKILRKDLSLSSGILDINRVVCFKFGNDRWIYDFDDLDQCI